MLTLLRHLLSIVLLPFVAAVLVPYWLLNAYPAADTRWHGGVLIAWLSRSAGIVLLLVGFVLFGWCVILFARVGQGTLAPWDPTRTLVGCHRHRHGEQPGEGATRGRGGR